MELLELNGKIPRVFRDKKKCSTNYIPVFRKFKYKIKIKVINNKMKIRGESRCIAKSREKGNVSRLKRLVIN